MGISEAQLETWSHQGQTGQFTATYETIKAVLDDRRAPFANRDADSFLQGSYKNDTNIPGDSDVDVILRTKAVYYSDTGRLQPDEKAKFEKGWSRATYQLADFKNEVVDWLWQQYGSAVVVGSKAITIAGDGSRRDADVLVCAEFRRYYSFENEYNPKLCRRNLLFSSGRNPDREFPRATPRQLHNQAPRDAPLVQAHGACLQEPPK